MKFIEVTSAEKNFEGKVYWLNADNIYSFAAQEGGTSIVINSSWPWDSKDHLVQETPEEILIRLES